MINLTSAVQVPLSTQIINEKKGVFNATIDGLNLVWDDDQILFAISQQFKGNCATNEDPSSTILGNDNTVHDATLLDTHVDVPQFTFGQTETSLTKALNPA